MTLDALIVEAEAGVVIAGTAAAEIVEIPNGASGGKALVVRAGPESEPVIVEWHLDLPLPGTYHVFLSSRSADDQVDSASLSLSSPGEVGKAPDAKKLGLEWSGVSTHDGGPLLSFRAQAGRRTVTLTVEDGDTAFDRIVVTRDNSLSVGSPMAVRAADFVNAIGINTHTNWADTIHYDMGALKRSLDYLGVRKIRDVLSPDSTQISRIEQLGHDGYRFNMVIGRDLGTLPEQLARLEGIAPYLESIEGANESDTMSYKNLTDGTLAGTKKLQRQIYSLVKASPVLGSKQIVQASFVKADTWNSYGDESASADYGNSHNYFNWGLPPGLTVRDRIVEAQKVTPGKRPVATEAGYHTAVNAETEWQHGVSEEVHAKYTLRMLAEMFSQGYRTIYLYQLFDDRIDPSKSEIEANWGVFLNDATPKPAATALRSLTALLADTDPQATSFTPSPLDYSIRGMPGMAGSLLLQKTDKSWHLLLWNDVEGWNKNERKPVVHPAVPVELVLSRPAASISVHVPGTGRIEPHTVHTNVDRILLDLPDELLVISILSPPS